MQVETTETAEERLAYTAEEACALAHCSKSFLYAEIRRGTLLTRKIGRKRSSLPSNYASGFGS